MHESQKSIGLDDGSGLPQLGFHKSLEKESGNVSVDIEKYMELLSALGMKKEDIAKQRVLLRKLKRPFNWLINGFTSASSGDVYLFVNNLKGKEVEKANSALIHESQHAVDVRDAGRKRKIIAFATRLPIYASPLASVTVILTGVSDVDTAVTYGAIGVGLGFYVEQKLNPFERRARRAEELHASNPAFKDIVKITDKNS